MQTPDYFQLSKRIRHNTNGDNAMVLIVDSVSNRSPSLTVMAVADGMSSCGDVGAPLSSQTALATVRAQLAPLFVDLDILTEMDAPLRTNYFHSLMKQAILAADRALWDAPDELKCTISLAILFEGTVYCANVGDSPIYMFHRPTRTLSACFECHNEAARLVKSGDISEREALTHKGKYRLTCSVGGLSRPDKRRLDESLIFTASVPFTADDLLLLGSDGALDVFPQKTLVSLVSSGRLSPEQICHRIYKAVLKHRGHDDCTIVAARYRT